MAGRASRSTAWWWRTALFVVATALLLLMVVGAILAVATGSASAMAVPAALALAAMAYLASHLVRVARLALIASDDRVSLRLLGRVHLFTAGVSLAIPFKLGDVYRAVELSAALGGVARAVIVIFIERALDVALILALLLLAIWSGAARPADYGPVLAASGLFVAVAVFAVAFLPDNLKRLASYVIRRYDAEWTVTALRGVAHARSVLHDAGLMLRGRFAALAALTLLIWGFELVAMGAVLSGVAAAAEPVATLITFLSALIRGDTLLSQLARGAVRGGGSVATDYLLATQVPLVFAALAVAARLAGQRLAQPVQARIRI